MRKLLQFERRERRYVADPAVFDFTALEHALGARAEPARYQVRTVYVDRAPGRLTPGRRVRLRLYPPDPRMWLEVKRRKGGRVWKGRLPIIAEVEYERTAFVWRGTRVTIDRELHESGTNGRRLMLAVIEVKGHLTRWLGKLLPAEAKGFSKLRWVQGKWVPPLGLIALKTLAGPE